MLDIHKFIMLNDRGIEFNNSRPINVKILWRGAIKKQIFDIISILLLPIFLSTSCNFFLESDDEISLELERGYYQKVSETPDKIYYSVEFDYFVEGIECKVGGFHIQWSENSRGIICWYMAQTLIPGQIYTISDTFKLSNALTSDPIVTMTGYLNGTGVVDPRLRDRLTLRNK